MIERRDYFKTTEFENGLNVYSIYFDRSWEIVTVLIKAGTRQEEKKGTAHFLEHAMVQNYENKDNEFENAEINLDRTHLKFSTPTKELDEEMFERIANTLFNKDIDPEDIEKQRKVIHQEYKRKYPTEVSKITRKEKNRVLYPDSWIGNFVLGSLETINGMTKEDLESFRSRYYVPENISLITAGGLKPREVFEMVSRTDLTADRKGESVHPPCSLEDPAPPKEKETVLRVSDYRKDFPEDNYGVEKRVKLPGSFSREAVEVLENMLYGLLFRKIRTENQWAYSVNCSTFNLGPLYELHISCRFSADSAEVIREAISEVLKKAKETPSLFEEERWNYLRNLKMKDYNVWDVCQMVIEDVRFEDGIRPAREVKNEVRDIDYEDIKKLIDIIETRSWDLIVVPR